MSLLCRFSRASFGVCTLHCRAMSARHLARICLSTQHWSIWPDSRVPSIPSRPSSYSYSGGGSSEASRSGGGGVLGGGGIPGGGGGAPPLRGSALQPGSASPGVEAGERPVNLVMVAMVRSTIGASSTGPSTGPSTGTCGVAGALASRVQAARAEERGDGSRWCTSVPRRELLVGRSGAWRVAWSAGCGAAPF
jgi:hypothetical protein